MNKIILDLSLYIYPPVHCSYPAATHIAGQQSTRLINNWQFLKQDIGGVWEAVRPVRTRKS